MPRRFHIAGTEEFGYSTISRFMYSLYFFENMVARLCKKYPNAEIDDLNGYIAHFCYIRMKSFFSFANVVKLKDYVTANCIVRMLGDSVAVFHIVYAEPDKNLRLLRHYLYVIDGCEDNLKVLPCNNEMNRGCMPNDELEESNKLALYNKQHRESIINNALEMIYQLPLKTQNPAAFQRIVEDRNWKFKEFKDYDKKRIKSNQYKWEEMYDRIEMSKYYNILSYMSQFSHGLSMSNLVMNLDENTFDGPVGEAFALLSRMEEYLLDLFKDERNYIYEGLLDERQRNRMIACYDKRLQPEAYLKWNEWIKNMM